MFNRVLKSSPKIVIPKLNLADYVDADAQPPDSVDRSGVLAGNALLTDPLGNRDWGDCGDAMAIHGIEAFHLVARTSAPPFETSDALNLYSRVSDFDPNAGPPGSNPTDVGTDNQALVDFWRDQGVTCGADGSLHTIEGSLFVPRDPRFTRVAIWEFTVLFRAVGLPITAQGQNTWQLTDPSLQGEAAVGSWGYHDIPYFSYGPAGPINDTWGEELQVTWDFDNAYAVQGFIVITPEMLDRTGVSASGVNYDALKADLAKFPAASQP